MNMKWSEKFKKQKKLGVESFWTRTILKITGTTMQTSRELNHKKEMRPTRHELNSLDKLNKEW